MVAQSLWSCGRIGEKIHFDLTFLSFVNKKINCVAYFLSLGQNDDYIKTCKVGFVSLQASVLLHFSPNKEGQLTLMGKWMSPNTGSFGPTVNQL